MKTKTIVTIIFLALAIVFMPVNAQTYKDKKAAKKAKWEMEQRHQLEESELRHQFKMDSISNAQNSYSITCYRLNQLKKGWAKVTKYGTYNQKDSILIVDNEKIRVVENPYFGEQSTPGRFRFKAGPFYFNL